MKFKDHKGLSQLALANKIEHFEIRVIDYLVFVLGQIFFVPQEIGFWSSVQFVSVTTGSWGWNGDHWAGISPKKIEKIVLKTWDPVVNLIGYEILVGNLCR